MLNWYKNKIKAKYIHEMARAAGLIYAHGSMKLLMIMTHPKSTDEQILRAAYEYRVIQSQLKVVGERIERYVNAEMD